MSTDIPWLDLDGAAVARRRFCRSSARQLRIADPAPNRRILWLQLREATQTLDLSEQAEGFRLRTTVCPRSAFAPVGQRFAQALCFLAPPETPERDRVCYGRHAS
jgi:hypothetical protein